MVFSESFVNNLKTVNDRKTRIDHETGNTHKHFWIRTALAYNNQQEDDVVHTVNEVINDTFHMAAALQQNLIQMPQMMNLQNLVWFWQLQNRIQPIKQTGMNSH